MRILSATHKNLARLVELGQFRQDLFYRINVIELRVPPLRERKEDIPKLAGRVLERLAADTGAGVARLQPDALKALLAYDFPGNVRELENVLERAVALCENNTIGVDDLQLVQRQPRPGTPPNTMDYPPPPRPEPLQASIDEDETPDGSLDNYISNIEREAIIRALEECRYNKTKAAAKLGITFRALRYKLKKLAIE